MRKLSSTLLAAATTLSLVISCGDDDPVRHLDGGVDSFIPMIDATDAPVPPPAVTLTITLNGSAQANVKVYFLAADSSVIANTTTDTNGVASAMMPNGGSVTAIDPFKSPGGLSSAYELYTFLGAKSGDHLRLKEGNGPLTDVTVTGPIDAGSNVSSYRFATPCASYTDSLGSGSNPTAPLSLDPRCSTTTDFLITSQDVADTVLHYAYIANQAVTTTIDLSAQTWSDPSTKTYELDNIGVFHNEMLLTQRIASTKGELAQLSPSMTGQGSGSASFSLAAPAFTNAASIIETRGYIGGTAEHHILEWGPFTTAKYTLDIAPTVLKDVTASPTVDTTAHAVTWTEDNATGQSPEFAVAFVSTNRPNAGMGWTWTIAGPHDGPSLAFPMLPTDVADFTIASTDSTFAEMLALGKGPGGYDAVRANIFGDESALITTATGTFAGESVQSSPPRTLPPHRWRGSWVQQLGLTPVSLGTPIKTRLTNRHR